jgi:hypothetical protein
MPSAPNIPEMADSIMVEPTNASLFHREKQEMWKKKLPILIHPKWSQQWVFPF